MAFIYFGHFNYKAIYILLVSLASIILFIIKRLISNIDNTKKNNKEPTYGTHAIVYAWIMFLSESMAIFCYLIKQWIFPIHGLYKRKKNEIPNKKKAIIIHIFFYFSLGLLDFTGNIIDRATNNSDTHLTDDVFLVVRFVLFVILCTILLKYKYYSHHVIGASIIILGLILNAFMEIKQTFRISVFLYCIASFVCVFCESLQNTLEKYLMDVHFFDPFMLLAGEGLSGLFISSIALLIGNYINCPENRYNMCMDKGRKVDDFTEAMSFLLNNKDYGLLYLLLFFTLFFYNQMKILMNQHFTPLHRNIAKDLRNFVIFFLKFYPLFGDNKEHPGNALLETGTYLVMFIGDLIFLEIIILGFCDLNKNTQEEIIKRENEDNSVRYLLDKESFSSLVSDE